MGYICEKCKKNFKTKEAYDNHSISKCDNITLHAQHQCKSCQKIFSTLSVLNRHIKEKHNSLAIVNIEPNNQSSQPNTTTNNIIKNKITNNITNNKTSIKIGKIVNKPINNTINIQPIFVKHGQERVDHITKDFLLKLLDCSSSQRMFVDLMATLYFSEEVPENNNWSLAYPYNDNAAIVFDYEKNEFTRMSNEKIIDQKFSNMIDKIVPMIDEIYKDKEKLTRNQYINILHFYDKECMYDLSEQCPDIYELIRKLAYEQRFIPMKTWKKSGFNGKSISIDFDKNDRSQYGEIMKPYKTI